MQSQRHQEFAYNRQLLKQWTDALALAQADGKTSLTIEEFKPYLKQVPTPEPIGEPKRPSKAVVYRKGEPVPISGPNRRIYDKANNIRKQNPEFKHLAWNQVRDHVCMDDFYFDGTKRT